MQELKEIIRQLREFDPDYDAEVRNMRDMKTNRIGQPPLLTPPDSTLVKALQKAVRLCGDPPQMGFFPGWTDAGILSSVAGIETVVFGPGDLSTAHSDNEFCPIDQIVKSCRAYVATILEICL